MRGQISRGSLTELDHFRCFTSRGKLYKSYESSELSLVLHVWDCCWKLRRAILCTVAKEFRLQCVLDHLVRLGIVDTKFGERHGFILAPVDSIGI